MRKKQMKSNTSRRIRCLRLLVFGDEKLVVTNRMKLCYFLLCRAKEVGYHADEPC